MRVDQNLSYSDPTNSFINKGIVIKIFSIPTAQTVVFKALDLEFKDQFVQEWIDEMVYGRSDPISNFKSTKRQISLSWQIVASDVDEAKENMRKISLLLSLLYPVFSPGQSGAGIITASPLFKLSLANLIQNPQQGPGNGLVGHFDSLAYDPVNDEGFFVPASNTIYAQTVKFSCTFTVFHTFKLGWGPDKKPREPKFPYGLSIGGKSTAVFESNKQGGTEQQKKAQQNACMKTYSQSEGAMGAIFGFKQNQSIAPKK